MDCGRRGSFCNNPLGRSCFWLPRKLERLCGCCNTKPDQTDGCVRIGIISAGALQQSCGAPHPQHSLFSSWGLCPADIWALPARDLTASRNSQDSAETLGGRSCLCISSLCPKSSSHRFALSWPCSLGLRAVQGPLPCQPSSTSFTGAQGNFYKALRLLTSKARSWTHKTLSDAYLNPLPLTSEAARSPSQGGR